MQCVSGALSGALGPAFLRNMHRIFRCVEQVDPGPITPPFRLDIQDVSHLSEGPAKAAAVASAIETATRRFDMKTQGWLFRATLVRTAADEHRFVLAWSHMISDGIAAAAFYRELVATYAHGAAVVLPKVASYGEYVRWEAEHLAAGAGKAELAFWAGLLGRDPEQLRLAGTPPRPRATAALPCRAGRVDFAIDAATRVVGLNFDFVAFNMTKHTAYLISNAALFFSPAVQRQYRRKHGPKELIPVAASDVAFSVHAVLLTAITVWQVLRYEHGGQRISRSGLLITMAAWAAAAVCTVLGAVSGAWLWLVTFFSYLQLTMTAIKYMPQIGSAMLQAYMNYRRRSTVGWSISNILLDLTGAVAALLQMLVFAIDQRSFENFSGNVGKLGLSLETLGFDLLFVVQHYMLYPDSSRRQRTGKVGSRADGLLGGNNGSEDDDIGHRAPLLQPPNGDGAHPAPPGVGPTR
eukprot:SM000150S01712  [mRNA]  locus=s150:183852:187090:- [translate_table: standard]